MTRELTIDGRRIADDTRAYLTVDLGHNHGGKMKRLEEMVVTAKASGADAVKFQKRTLELVYTKEELDRPRESPYGITNHDQKAALEFSEDDYKVIDAYCKKKGIPWLHAADICSPAVAVAYGIGRIGCHIAGDGDWGTLSDVPWAVQYTNAIIGWVHPLTGVPYPEGAKVHPTPLYEMLQSLVIFGILWSLRKKDYPPGVIFWLYLILAGLARFTVEFWRVNPVAAFGVTQAQSFAIILVLLGGYMIWSTFTRQRT